MTVPVEQVKELRKATAAPMLDCKKALQHSDGDFDMAVDWLRQKGLSIAAKKAGRVANEGVIDTYIHHDHRLGVIVEVNCETDFVARTDDFQTFVRDVAMHIAAEGPVAVSREDLEPAVIEKEKEIYLEQARNEGKPAHIAEKIVTGRLDKYFQEVCLMEQAFVKEPDKTIQDLFTELTAKIGEKITIRRFSCFRLGEG